METICMKCQIPCPGKNNRKNIWICRLLKILPSVLSVKIYNLFIMLMWRGLTFWIYLFNAKHAGKNSADDTEICFLFLLENRLWHFMQIVSIWVNLHDNVKACFLEKNKKNIICLSSSELAKRMVKVKVPYLWLRKPLIHTVISLSCLNLSQAFLQKKKKKKKRQLFFSRSLWENLITLQLPCM